MVTNRRLVKDTVEGNAYATPFWCTQLLLAAERFEGRVWECCAGSGHISKVLLDNGYETYSSDLYSYPRLDSLNADHVIQTNLNALLVDSNIENIITNPPYSEAEDFIRLCDKIVTNKYALLLRLAFLEGGNRCVDLFSTIAPRYVYVIADRVSMYPFGDLRTTGGTTAYAWYIFDKTVEYTHTELRWLYYDTNKENKYERTKKRSKKFGSKNKKKELVQQLIEYKPREECATIEEYMPEPAKKRIVKRNA